MDRIPLEIYRLIVSMIDDGEYPVWGYNTDSSEPTINMQGQLRNPLATFRKLRPMTLIRKLRANTPRNCIEKNSDEVLETRVRRLATLKSLRLCNKKLAAATAEFMFEEVLLHFTKKSHANLEAISQHPLFKDYVRVLQILPKAISGPLVPELEFGQWLRGERTVLDHATLPYVGEDCPEPLVMPGCVNISRKVINFHYREYSSLHAKQQKLLATAEGVLQTAVGRLPQLKRVESGLYYGWSRTMLDIPPNNFEPSTRHYWYRERRNLSPKDGMIDELWKAGAMQKTFDMDQAAMVLRAVACGRLISGAQIDAGPLFRDLSPTAMHITDPEEKAVVDMLIADTKHFNLYLRTADFYAIHETMDYGTIFKFLQGMTKLESMRIRSACCDIDTPFYKAFGKIITWPNLTQLSIQSLHSCEFSDLAAVIQLHKAILRRLTLYNIDYDDESRCNIRADLRAGAMDKIRIWNLQRRVGEARDLIDSGPPLLFSDGAWSPRLGSYLRGEVVAKLFPSFAHAQKGLLAEDDERT